MKMYLALAIACAATIPVTGVATGAPTGGMAAPDVVRELTNTGYNVQINGATGVPLSQCTVTGVHGIPADPAHATTQFTTVYVDVDCEADG